MISNSLMNIKQSNYAVFTVQSDVAPSYYKTLGQAVDIFVYRGGGVTGIIDCKITFIDWIFYYYYS